MEKNENQVIMTIASEIKEIGKTIGEDKKEGSKQVRQFQGKWRNKLNVEGIDSGDPNIDFLIFFLCNFIEDFYYNLAGDFPNSKEVEKARESIMEGIGRTFINISENLEASNFTECYESCANMVNLYLEKIQHLNRTLAPKIE